MAEQKAPREGREGSRWVNQAPTAEEFATWFKDNVPIDPKLKHEDYVGGLVLIPAVDEKAKSVDGFAANGSPIIVQRPVMYYVPYARVETRVQYFWNLMEAHAGEWVGVIEPVVTERPEPNQLASAVTTAEGEETSTYRTSANAAIVEQLPPGFFLLPVPLGSAYTHFLCCSYRVAVYHVEDEKREWPIRQGHGTKMVPLLLGRDTKYPSPHALMLCETGAVGRAIAFAGIFNIGTGVASAEDILEALSQERAAPSDHSGEQVVAEGGRGPAAPADAAPAGSTVERAEEDDAALQARVLTMAATLRDDHPQKWTEFGRWCHQRRPAITSLTQKGPALRGLARKLEKSLVEAEQAQSAATVADALADGAAEVAPEPAPAPREPEEPGTPAPVEGGA